MHVLLPRPIRFNMRLPLPRMRTAGAPPKMRASGRPARSVRRAQGDRLCGAQLGPRAFGVTHFLSANVPLPYLPKSPL